MSIFTTKLVIPTSEDVSSCSIIIIGKIILKVFIPLKNLWSKLSKVTDRLKSDSSKTLGISNTSVSEYNAKDSALIFTNSANDCSCNSTKTITIDDNCGSSSITTTRVNNSNRNNTTIDNNGLCQSTFTRVNSDIRQVCITTTIGSDTNTLNRTTDVCFC